MSMERNVVLLVLDTVRQDYFREFAPRIQSLSDVSFNQCRAASSCSVPSHGSILTGKLPSESGVHNFNVDYGSVPTEETFLSNFDNHHTIGVSANEYVSTEFGFSNHFEKWYNISPYRRFPEGIDIKHFTSAGKGKNLNGANRYLSFLWEAFTDDAPIQSIANGFSSLTDQWFSKAPIPKLIDDGANAVSRQIQTSTKNAHEPFFLFANYMDAHSPMHHVRGYDRDIHDASNSWTSTTFPHFYDVIFNIDNAREKYSDFISTYRGLYSASIEYLDRKISNIIEWLGEITDRPTTIVVTADHGENLAYEAEDYLFGHNSSLSEGLLHVPFEIINPPKGYDKTESELFSHLDLGWLLHEMAKGNTPNVFRNEVAAEIIAGEVDFAKEILSKEEYEYFRRAQRTVMTKDEKWVWDSLDTSIKYQLNPDRPNWETELETDCNLPDSKNPFKDNINKYRNIVDSGKEFLDRQNIDESTKSRLKELGYL